MPPTNWLRHRDIEREQLLGLLLGALYGAVTASGAPIANEPS
jgi:hypothetical protein